MFDTSWMMARLDEEDRKTHIRPAMRNADSHAPAPGPPIRFQFVRPAGHISSSAGLRFTNSQRHGRLPRLTRSE